MKLPSDNQEQSDLTPFTIEELNDAICSLCNNKALGIDEINNEMLKHYGMEAKNRLLELTNDLLTQNEIPTIW